MDPSLKTYIGGMVATNGYLLRLGDQCYVIDAPKGMYDFVKSEGVKPDVVLLTHQHYDHVEDASYFSKDGIPIYAYQPYSPPLVMKELAERWGMNVKVEPFTVTKELKGKEMISEGAMSIVCIHVPGHSPDSIAYYFAGKQFLFCGDTLFKGAIGRTDLPFGDHEALLSGIKENLLTLGNSVEVFPGHGEETTIGLESELNPFLR